MVYGEIETERLDLNEDTLWSGGPINYNRKDAYKHLTEIQELVRNQEFEKAVEIGDQYMLGTPPKQQAYQPLGTLKIHFNGQSEADDYCRELDMRSGIARVHYRRGDTTFKREIFASHPDQVIVIELSCDQPGQLSFTLGLESPHPYEVQVEKDDILALSGQVPAHEGVDLLGPWKGPGTRFEAQIKVAETDGTVVSEGGSLSVTNAQHATLIYTAATAYINYTNVSGDPGRRCSEVLEGTAGKSYRELLERHKADHEALFDRVSIDLGESPFPMLPTDRRIQKLAEEKPDPELIAQAFQFGRYLLMACSRPGTQPANLQGIWNESTRPPWGSKWTLNINAPMNYWPVETCNLSELHEPLLRLLEECREPGRETAREYYDCDGFVIHHNTDLWRGTAPLTFYWGAWPMGAAWLSHHIWEHYAFTQDKAFLKKSYPTMREAAEFFVDFLTEDENGYLVTNPSLSFEQGFVLANGTEGRVCMGPTMDMQILRALFTHCIEAGRILDTDEAFAGQLIVIRSRLVPNRVNPETGRLLEWRDDREPSSYDTGQLGHLWGLCPGDEITPWGTPELARGAENSLLFRKISLGSWCSGTRLNYSARLHNAPLYEQLLNDHMKGQTLPNMMSHFNRDRFQIDGNLGMTASVAEALIQSHGGEIHILPALPPSWGTGSVKGLRARGGFQLDLEWANGKLKAINLISLSGQRCVLVYADKKRVINTESGKSYCLDSNLNLNFL